MCCSQSRLLIWTHCFGMMVGLLKIAPTIVPTQTSIPLLPPLPPPIIPKDSYKSHHTKRFVKKKCGKIKLCYRCRRTGHMARDCTIPLQTRTPATYQTEKSLSSAILKTSAKPVPDAKAPDTSKYCVSYLPSGTPLCPDHPHIGSDDLSTLNPEWDIENGCDAVSYTHLRAHETSLHLPR